MLDSVDELKITFHLFIMSFFFQLWLGCILRSDNEFHEFLLSNFQVEFD